MKQSPGAGAHDASAPAAFHPPSVWLADRARNALRHPTRAGAVAAIVFVAALLALVIVPREQRRAADELPAVAERVDTLSLLTSEGGARQRLFRATESLDSLRLALAAADSADSAAATRPRQHSDRPSADSLLTLARELTRLLARSERAPLPASYRDLAAAQALRADPRVSVLIDSLGQVERAQRSYGSVGGVDAGYLLLSERANSIGARLAGLARQRRAQLRGDDPSDTLRRRDRLGALQLESDSLARALAMARATNVRVATAISAARERANIDAPPIAMLAAALALALAVGGAASLGMEMALPRVASVRDAQDATGAPVVGALDDDRASVERLTRRITSEAGGRARIAICASDAGISARVGAAIASATATFGRAVLVVDTDTATGAASLLLRRRPSPGASDVMARGATWGSVLDTHIGSHSLPVDVVPAGAPIPRAPDTATVEGAGRSLNELTMAYDLTIVCVSRVDRPIVEVLLTAATVRDAYLCAELGETPLALLRGERDRWRAAGTPLQGVILVAAAFASGGGATRRSLAGR